MIDTSDMTPKLAPQSIPAVVRLDGTDATLVIGLGDREPTIIYWGMRLASSADLHHLVDTSIRTVPPNALAIEPLISVSPSIASGFSGQPGFAGHVAGDAWCPMFVANRLDWASPFHIVIHCSDTGSGLSLSHHFSMDALSDVLTVWSELSCDEVCSGFVVDRLSAPIIPLDGRTHQIMTFSGRWSGEFAQHILPFPVGAIVRENRRGRTSHDCFPGMIAMAPGCDEEAGLSWGFHLGASGNHQMRAERFSDGRALLSAGELLLPGEIRLGEGRQSYTSPKLFSCVSRQGLTGVSRAFQSFVRTSILPPAAKAKPRPVHYNTWEAVYFDHDQSVLFDLARRAADLGVERFVLDDGWFGGRRHDRAGLGDWTVSQGVYPDGLGPLIAHVNALGMEFGLWVEPEMVNPDSDLYRAHPDWVLQAPGVPQRDMRHQWVLDLTQQAVCEYLYSCLDNLLRAHPITYLKWDMNRDLSHPGGRDGKPAASDYVGAVHALLDRLRVAHPTVEIESCASGGGRANFEILRRTDRIWTSDSNDALDRLVIQRGCSLFFPPEVMGAHVGPRDCHITGRRISMDMRAGVALFGHLGLEMDLRELTPSEGEALKAAIAMYKEHRALLHDGTPIRFNQRPFEERWGVVSHDRQQGLFGYALTGSLPDTVPGRFWFSGLDPAGDYRLAWIWPQPTDRADAQRPSCGLASLNGQVVSGTILMQAGVELPYMKPQSLVIVSLVQA